MYYKLFAKMRYAYMLSIFIYMSGEHETGRELNSALFRAAF